MSRIGRLLGLTAPRATIIPTIVILIVCFYASMLWTTYISFTASRLLPNYDFVGLDQYQRLLTNARWQTAFGNMFLFGGLFIFGALLLGTILAMALDRRLRFEGGLRTIFLYPFCLSFIVAGLAWQWFLNPTHGLERIVRDLGFESFRFDWLVNADMAIYTIVIAGIWRNAGLVMALMLAGLRAVSPEIWRAARVEGIPVWATYLHVVLPMQRPMIMTAFVMLATSVITSYDLVVSMTGGGPGYASDIPAKFVMDFLFNRANLGLASAGAVVMLLAIIAATAPYLIIELRRRAP